MECNRPRSIAYRLRQICVSSFCLLAVVCIVSSLYSISSTLGKEKKVRITRSIINLRNEDTLDDNKSNKAKIELQANNKPKPIASQLEEVEKQSSIEDVNDEVSEVSDAKESSNNNKVNKKIKGTIDTEEVSDATDSKEATLGNTQVTVDAKVTTGESDDLTANKTPINYKPVTGNTMQASNMNQIESHKKDIYGYTKQDTTRSSAQYNMDAIDLTGNHNYLANSLVKNKPYVVNSPQSVKSPTYGTVTNVSNEQLSKTFNSNNVGDANDNNWKEIDINATVNLNIDNENDSDSSENEAGEEEIAEPSSVFIITNGNKIKSVKEESGTRTHGAIPDDDVDDIETDTEDEGSSEDKTVTKLPNNTSQQRVYNNKTKIENSSKHKKTSKTRSRKNRRKNKKRTKKNYKKKNKSLHKKKIITDKKVHSVSNIAPTTKKFSKTETNNFLNTRENKLPRYKVSNTIKNGSHGNDITLDHGIRTKKLYPVTNLSKTKLHKAALEEAYKIIEDEKKSLKDDDIENESEININSETEDSVPTFPENYHASGLLLLPHSNIAEPFEIWYAPSSKRSRIDYYYGTDKTIQRGDHGEHGRAYKYVPMYTDRQGSYDGCWTITGNKNRPVIPQVITPNITWFKYNKTEVYTGALATKWSYEYYAFGMRNFQHLWITKHKPYRPIRYEMYGFDMMLGSYYDHYVIEYISFEAWNIDNSKFDLPSGIQCYNWSTSLETSLMVNPMQEFTAFSPDKAVDISQRYLEYKKEHDKEEADEKAEEIKRMHIFKHNARYINSHNRRNLQFKLKKNKFLDLKPEELQSAHGTLENDTGMHEGIKEKEEAEKTIAYRPEIPDELDWRDYGAVSHVKGQAICGACYAFTAAGAAEGAWFRKTGKRVEVSSQQIVDCSWGTGNHGCKGGHYAAGLSWIYSHGVSTQKSYGKYLGQEGYCHFNDTWFGAKIDGFTYIQPYNITALKQAVVKFGPIAISLNTLPLSFKFYSHGVYSDPKCVSNRTQHSALVIGYGKQNGEDYWLVKNSWSVSWGEDGYIKIAMKDHLCGVTEYPIAALVNEAQFKLPMQQKASPGDIGIKVPPTSGRHFSPTRRNSTALEVTATFDKPNSTTSLNKTTNEKITTTTERLVIKIERPQNDTKTSPSEIQQESESDKSPSSSVLPESSNKKVDFNTLNNESTDPDSASKDYSNANEVETSVISTAHNPENNKVMEPTTDDADAEETPTMSLENMIASRHSKKNHKNDYEHVKYALEQNNKIERAKKPAQIDTLGLVHQSNTSNQNRKQCINQAQDCEPNELSSEPNNVLVKTMSNSMINNSFSLVTSDSSTKQAEADGDISVKMKTKPLKSTFDTQNENGFIVGNEERLKTNDIDEPNEHTNIVEAPPDAEDDHVKKLTPKEMKLQKVKDALKKLFEKPSAVNDKTAQTDNEKNPQIFQTEKDKKTETVKTKHKKLHKTNVIPFFGLHIKDEDEEENASKNALLNANDENNITEHNDNTNEKPEVANYTKQEVLRIITANKTTIIQVKDVSNVKPYKETTQSVDNKNSNSSDSKLSSNDDGKDTFETEMAGNLSESAVNSNEMSNAEMSEHLNSLSLVNRTKEPSLNEDRFEEISTHLIDLRKELMNDTENVIIPTEKQIVNNNGFENEKELYLKDEKHSKEMKVFQKKKIGNLFHMNDKNEKVPNHQSEKREKTKPVKTEKGMAGQNGKLSNKYNIKDSTTNRQSSKTKTKTNESNKETKVKKPKRISHQVLPSQKSTSNKSPTTIYNEHLQSIIQKLPLLHVAQNMYHHIIQKQKKKEQETIKEKVLEHQKELHEIVSKLKTKQVKIDKSSWNKPTVDPESIGTFLNEQLKEKTGKVRPEEATLLGSKKNIIVKHFDNRTVSSYLGKRKYQKVSDNEIVDSQHQKFFDISAHRHLNFKKQNEIDLEHNHNINKKTIKKNNYKLSRVEKAYKESMDFLYSRVNQAVQKKPYN